MLLLGEYDALCRCESVSVFAEKTQDVYMRALYCGLYKQSTRKCCEPDQRPTRDELRKAARLWLEMKVLCLNSIKVWVDALGNGVGHGSGDGGGEQTCLGGSD